MQSPLDQPYHAPRVQSSSSVIESNPDHQDQAPVRIPLEQEAAPPARESDEESEEAVADYDYAFENIEYLKPVLVRFPGGKIAIGT